MYLYCNVIFTVPRDPDTNAYARHINLQLTYSLQNPHVVLQHLQNNNNNNSSIINNNSINNNTNTMQNMNGASSLCSGTNPNSGSSSIGSSVGSHSSNTNNNHSPKFAGIAGGGGLAHGIYGKLKKKKKKD